MNKPGQPTVQQILQAYFDQLDYNALVKPDQVAEATGLLPITVSDNLTAMAREGKISKARNGRCRHYRRKRTQSENAWWQFCFINAAQYGNRSASCH